MSDGGSPSADEYEYEEMNVGLGLRRPRGNAMGYLITMLRILYAVICFFLVEPISKFLYRGIFSSYRGYNIVPGSNFLLSCER